jgi:hypothetical protein
MAKRAGTAIKQMASVCFAGSGRQRLLATLVLVGCLSPFGAFVNAQQQQDKPIDRYGPYHPRREPLTAEAIAILDGICDCKFYDLHVRVPGWYMAGGYISILNKLAKKPIEPTVPHIYNIEFGFGFWVSDSKPLKIRGDMEEVAGWEPFWPPEPGRPTSGAEDFFVRVFHVRQVNVERPEDRQKCTSETCSTPTGDPTLDVTPIGEYMRVYFLSRADGITGAFDMPSVGDARVREVACKALSLIRTWRVSEVSTPTPEDCARFKQ